jgi:hypothetical protein
MVNEQDNPKNREEPASFSQPLELEQSQEAQLPSLEQLVARLGFVEAPELSQLRAQVAEAAAAQLDPIDLIGHYQEQAAELVSAAASERVRAGLMIQEALIYYDSNLPEEGLHSLRLAYVYADNQGSTLADVAGLLKPHIATTRLLDQLSPDEVATISVSVLADICRDELAAADCDYMATLPLHRALHIAIILLLERGHTDPEGLLQSNGFLG